MYPAEWLALINENRHPRYHSAGVMRSRCGDRPRHDARWAPHGTTWFGNFAGLDDTVTIAANEIPYATLRPDLDEWNEDQAAWGVGFEFIRGWRNSLRLLLLMGCLRNSDRISALLGEESRDIIPRRYRLQ